MSKENPNEFKIINKNERLKYRQTINELKQQLAETEQKFLEFQEDSIRNEQIYIRELAEKQNTIDEINKEFVQAVHDWKTLCKKKDKEIAHLKEMDNYHLLYELAGADETIANLKQQLAEKDKEIEKLKQQYTILENENGKLTTELIMDKYKKAQKEVSFGKQLAIQKLEEVKKEMDLNGNSYCEIRQGTSPHNPTDYAWFNYVKFRNYLNQQIKELKGEKDGK